MTVARDLAAPGAFEIMGILNVTPDSFSDGGLFVDSSAAVKRALQMIEEGASIIDVGGESTRPGAAPVSIDEELERVIPVIEGIREANSDVVISIDTMKAPVAKAALAAGAGFINDVSAGKDPQMFAVAAEAGVDICLMHMQGEPRTMQKNPVYSSVVSDVREELLSRTAAAVATGVSEEHIVLDPGIGFGKTLEDNLALLKHLRELVGTGFRVLVGASRKSFLGTLLQTEVTDRLEGSLAVATWAYLQGAWGVRVHDVRSTQRAVLIARAIAHAPDS